MMYKTARRMHNIFPVESMDIRASTIGIISIVDLYAAKVLYEERHAACDFPLQWVIGTLLLLGLPTTLLVEAIRYVTRF